jgi:hypothetical protein
MVAGLTRDASTNRTLRPATAGTCEVGRKIALELFFRERTAMTKYACAGSFHYECAASHRLTRLAGQRFRDGITGDGIWPQFLCVGSK